jgi:hypothetical protein
MLLANLFVLPSPQPLSKLTGNSHLRRKNYILFEGNVELSINFTFNLTKIIIILVRVFTRI